MSVLGIDPGYGRCGLAFLDGDGSRPHRVASTCIETSAKEAFGARLFAVADAVANWIDTHKPDAVAIEEVYFSANQKTAIHVAEVRGALLYLAQAKNVPVFEYNPLAVKIAVTGYGKATKDQVISMITKVVANPPGDVLDDEFDAVAVAVAHLAESRTRNIGA
ncbi:MAG TPA: crossover junction endodeoxyribonuclease RuvC [Candidatus Paceibacterota bacterium]|nr:crossover junction endodeoxyribonuclease RuvC [Candidatus Paceibacterota bacterium]